MERNQAVLPHRPFFPDDPSSLMTDDVDDSKAVHCPLSAGGAVRALTVKLVKKTVGQKVDRKAMRR
jgi:hypothetical protein